MNHGNIKPWQHCNYACVHLNTVGSEILAENFILALSTQTWLKIIQDNDVLIENVSEAELNSELAKISAVDNMEIYESIWKAKVIFMTIMKTSLFLS